MHIHWFSPLPPAPTEIAQHTLRLLPVLRARAEVTLWTSQAEPPESVDGAEVRRFVPGHLPRRWCGDGEPVFFQIGNNARYHRDIWQICREYPGIAVLHDAMLHDAVVNHCRFAPEVEGVYPDGWTSDRVRIAFAGGGRIALRLAAPAWLSSPLAVQTLAETQAVPPGERIEIVRDLPPRAGSFEVRFSPAGSAAADPRILAAFLESLSVVGPGGQELSYGRESYCGILESLYGPRGRRDAELHWRGVLSLDRMAAVYSCLPWVLPSARAVVVHSRMAERAVRRESRVPVARLAIPAPARGVPPERVPEDPPWRLVVFGHLGANRGIDAILEALHLLDQERGLFRLHIYGTLHDPEAARRRIEQLGLREIAAIHGRVSDEELEAALAGAHLGLNLRDPTRGEASTAQLRIWSHGLPAIVTQIGWYAEQPAGTVAFLRPRSMVEDLAALLGRYAADPRPFLRMGLAGYRHFAAHHTVERYVEGLLDVAARASRHNG